MTDAVGTPTPGSTVRPSDGDRGPVLSWSGPLGWRTLRPRLAARSPHGTPASDAGFTLVELMVVLLVLGILLAIAIPTFLGTTNAADDRSAQSNLVTALTDAQAQFQGNGQTFYVNGVQDSAGFASLLTGAQLSLTFKAGSLGGTVATGSSGSMSVVSVAVSADGNGVVLAAYSVPGNCFYIVQNNSTLSSGSTSVSPYSGATAVTKTATASTGTLGLPTGTGTNYVTVKGDTTMADCNAYTPKISGTSATSQYATSGFS